MTGDELSESAKAVQEVAKTAKAGIEATEKLGGFVSRIIGEPLDEVVGILTDKLKYFRWTRRIRLTDRANEFLRERNIEKELRKVSPKIALPIIENGSMEENDELQDLWAKLICSAIDPNSEEVRVAFIDILKQLEVIDAHILNYIYQQSFTANEVVKRKTHRLINRRGWVIKCENYPISNRIIMNIVNIDEISYRESIDNLIRVRCLAPYISDEKSNVLSGERDAFSTRMKRKTLKYNIVHDYEKVCITPLGLRFAESCMNQSIK